VELEHKKSLSNKERQELNRLRKQAADKGIDLDTFRNARNSNKHSRDFAEKKVDDDEAEITALMETAKDFGALKI
jgi:hypothetical protein